jgi:glyoxylase-like metal-dependent hydrolase (beta-lactamase superfamily II)
MLWDVVNDEVPFEPLHDGERIHVADVDLQVIATPGHSPGGVCLWSADLGVVLTGDTLFHGGPGATGRSYSHFGTILDSIRERLLTLPADTRVLTGHGDETTIGAEASAYDDWVARGH